MWGNLQFGREKIFRFFFVIFPSSLGFKLAHFGKISYSFKPNPDEPETKKDKMIDDKIIIKFCRPLFCLLKSLPKSKEPIDEIRDYLATKIELNFIEGNWNGKVFGHPQPFLSAAAGKRLDRVHRAPG
jgi:hypothetical protein